MKLFHVIYDSPEGISTYTLVPTNKKEAEALCESFRERYVGKPFPNGRGFYPYTNPRVILA